MPAGKICQKCGNLQEDENAFCPQCGSPVSSTHSEPLIPPRVPLFISTKKLLVATAVFVTLIVTLMISASMKQYDSAQEETTPAASVASEPAASAADVFEVRVKNDAVLQAFYKQLQAMEKRARPEDCGSSGCWTPEIAAAETRLRTAGYVQINYPVDCEANACAGQWAYKTWPEVAAYNAYVREHAPKPVVKPLAITAQEYYEDYNSNEVLADSKYKGKQLALTGVVTKIAKDVTNNNFITLSAGNYNEVAIYGVSTEEALKLQKGMSVTVKCQGVLQRLRLSWRCTTGWRRKMLD